ncbi:hypothetical protein KR018_012037 [Drosophila ironensis]|nr:hypothetical protein KR018_012037 [Drosophila ironensis]
MKTRNQKKSTTVVKKEPIKKLNDKVNIAAQFPARRIPKHVLTRTLEIANNPLDEFWLSRNSSCTAPISYEMTADSHNRRSITYEKLQLMRTCLLQRDFKNLAKLLASNLAGDTKVQRSAYHIYSQYANLLQDHTKIQAKLQQTRLGAESAEP